VKEREDTSLEKVENAQAMKFTNAQKVDF